MQTSIGVNCQLIRLYWSIGKDIVKIQENERYGDALIYQLSEDLQREFPDIKGFSYRNIHYMKNMYLLFKQGKADSYANLYWCKLSVDKRNIIQNRFCHSLWQIYIYRCNKELIKLLYSSLLDNICSIPDI